MQVGEGNYVNNLKGGIMPPFTQMYWILISPKLTLALIRITPVQSASGCPSMSNSAKDLLQAHSTRYFRGIKKVSSPKEQLALMGHASAMDSQPVKSMVDSPKLTEAFPPDKQGVITF